MRGKQTIGVGRVVIWLIAAAALAGCAAAPAAPPMAASATATPPLAGTITVTQVSVTADEITFAGRSTLPDGACLQTQLFARSVPVDWWPLNDCVPVRNGAWALAVPLGQGGAPAALDPTVDYTLRAWAFDDPGIQSELFWLELAGPPTPPSATPTATVEPPDFNVTPSDPAEAALLPPLPVTPPPAGRSPAQPPAFNVDTDRPEAWTREYLRLVTDMLNAGGDVEAVLDQVVSWMPKDSTFEGPRPPNAWAIARDLDGDGKDEWLISVPGRDRSCQFTFCPGYVLIFETYQGLLMPVHLLFGDEGIWEISKPVLLATEDINADGLTEVVIRQDICGAHTCFTSLLIGRWDGREWHNLAADRIEQAYTEYKIVDLDGDGSQEITMHGGMIGSSGAGLQRPHTLVFAWRDGAYRRIEDTPDAVEHPYYRMLDANRALASGDLDRALELALAVVDATSFEDEMGFMDGWAHARITTYAAGEALIVYALQGDLPAMEELLFEVQLRSDLTPNVYSEAIRRVVDVYKETGDAPAACRALEAVAARQPDEAVFFQEYGYGTERMTLDQLCPLDAPPAQSEPEL